MSIKSIINDIMTTTSGDAVDLVRVMALIGFVTFLGLAIYSVISAPEHHFEMISFGTGLGGVIAATGAAIKLSPDNKE